MSGLLRDLFISMTIIILILLYYARTRKNKALSWYYAGYTLLTVIMVFVFSITGISPLSGFHISLSESAINLIPFRGITDILKFGSIRFSLLNIAGNILLFSPIGLLVPILGLGRINIVKTLAVGFSISLAIELTQLFLIRGTDIDDILLNTLGTAIGYAFYALVKKRLPWTDKTNSEIYEKGRPGLLLALCIAIPYIVIVACGFYDRFIFRL